MRQMKRQSWTKTFYYFIFSPSQGPLKLGDPFYRGLTKMETDPMLPARMRDTARSELCTDVVKAFTECTQRAGFGLVYACRKERDDLVACIDTWMQVQYLRISTSTYYYLTDCCVGSKEAS